MLWIKNTLDDVFIIGNDNANSITPNIKKIAIT